MITNLKRDEVALVVGGCSGCCIANVFMGTLIDALNTMGFVSGVNSLIPSSDSDSSIAIKSLGNGALAGGVVAVVSLIARIGHTMVTGNDNIVNALRKNLIWRGKNL